MIEKTIGTHQPNYIPWMGYFYKIANCDVFVFLDDVQFSKTGAHNYHYIKSAQETIRLKIPVKHSFTAPIKEVLTNDHGGWKKRHLDQIVNNYKNAPFFDFAFPEFEKLLLKEYSNLAQMNIEIIHFFMDKFDLKTSTIRSSELKLSSELKGEDRIIEICKSLDASIYYSGRGAKAYQKDENFNEFGIKLIYDNFHPVEYNQLGNDFIPNVSVIDYVFNYGYEWDNYIKMFNEK